MNTTPKLLLLCIGIMLSCNAVAAPNPKKPTTAKRLAAETAARIKADSALQAAISGLAGGLPGPAGTPGPQGPAGIPGAQGLTGIVSTNSFAGQIADINDLDETNMAFRGPTIDVSVTATQRITATVTSALGTINGTADIEYNLCYQSVPSGTITQFSQDDFFAVTATPNITSFTASQSIVPGVAGDYKVGMCIRNMSDSTPINKNDWGQGWVMVTN